MKILYTTEVFPTTGGSSIFLQGLSEALLTLGHKAVILTSDLHATLKIKSTKEYNIVKIPYDPYNFILKFFFKVKNIRKSYLIRRLFNIIDVQFSSYLKKKAKQFSKPLIWGLFYDPFGWKLLLKLLRTNTKDVDLFFTTPIPRSCIVATLIAAKIKKVPVFITPAYHLMLENYTINNELWANILKKFDMVITYTNAELNYLYKLGVPRKILKFVGAGVPFCEINSSDDGNWREKLKIPKDKFVILYINSAIADHNKGIDSVIKSALKLLDTYFIFVGRYKEDWKYLQKLHNFQKSNNIKYLEFLSNDEKFHLYNAVDLIVKPSINDSFGLVYFEGMSAGKPIITSDIAPMKEIVKDVGISIPFNNVDKLIEAVKELKENREFYQKLSENALTKSKSFSWENIGKKYEKIFIN